MAIEVRIPTILRTYTDGAKSVEGAGDTLAELIEDLEGNHPGIKERLVEGADLRRFVNVYVNDEDVRFTGGLGTQIGDGDQVVVLPAVAGGGGFETPLRGSATTGLGGGGFETRLRGSSTTGLGWSSPVETT